jgi:hypothetical protein
VTRPKPNNPINDAIKRPQLTVDRLRSLLTFEPATDQFIWRVARGRARAGDVAGTGHHTGFRRIGIDGGSYRADRLASLYVARQHDGRLSHAQRVV